MKNPRYTYRCFLYYTLFLYFENHKIKYAIDGKIGGSSQMMLTEKVTFWSQFQDVCAEQQPKI